MNRSEGDRVRTGVFMLIVMASCTLAALADGFRNPPEGGAALGRAGTRLTQGDDPSAISHNPANILDLTGVSVMPSVTIGYGKKEYTAVDGISDKTSQPWHYMPSVYGVWSRGDVAVGLGVSTPFGQANEWEENGILQPYYSSVRSVNANPTVALKLGKHLMAGAGVDILWSEVELRQSLANPAMPGDFNRMTLKGDGYGFGANVGLTWLITDKQRMSVVYRAPISVDCDGDFSLEKPLPLPPPLASMLSSSGDFESKLEFPTVVAAGYGIRVLDALRIEADVEWIEHSRYDEAKVDLGQNNPLIHIDQLIAPAPMVNFDPLTVRQDWQDTWTFSLGADWDMTPNWTLRGGFTWLPTPVPDETINSSTAESDQSLCAIGLGFHTGSQRLDVAYAPAFARDRKDAAGGTYEFTSHLMAASYSVMF